MSWLRIGGGDYAPWSSFGAQGRVAWSLRAFEAKLDFDLSLRPQRGRDMQ
jgi:hypothetical protein